MKTPSDCSGIPKGGNAYGNPRQAGFGRAASETKRGGTLNVWCVGPYQQETVGQKRELLRGDEGSPGSGHTRHSGSWQQRWAAKSSLSGTARERARCELPLIAGTPTGLWYNTTDSKVTRGKMISNEDTAYIAAFVDADGHIGICRQLRTAPSQRHFNPRYQAELVVTNNDRHVLEWMSGFFGGGIGVRPQVLPHHKPTYRWKISDRLARHACEVIMPYLRIKRRQAELVVALCDLKASPKPCGKGVRLVPERVAKYESIYQQFKSLNDDRRPQRPSGVAPRTGEAMVRPASKDAELAGTETGQTVELVETWDANVRTLTVNGEIVHSEPVIHEYGTIPYRFHR